MDREKINRFLEVGQESRVVIVDDDDVTCEAVIRLLGDSYSVCAARSGEEYLEMMASQRPDLVLLDIQMTGMDGFVVFEKMKEMGYRDVPVIFLTAEHDAKIHADALAAGAVDYIEKPAHPLILRQRVEKALVFDAAIRHLTHEIESRDKKIADSDMKVRSLSAKVADLTETKMTLLRSR